MRISLIVAISENRVIGNRGQLPWHLPADLKRFKRLTMRHHIIMGRKTFESIGRQLPGRTSIVITRQHDYNAVGALVAHDLKQALDLAAGDKEVFIIGGAEVYRRALAKVDRVYLTFIHAEVAGDTYFTEFDDSQWTKIDDERHPANENNEFEYSFRVYERAPSPATGIPKV